MPAPLLIAAARVIGMGAARGGAATTARGAAIRETATRAEASAIKKGSRAAQRRAELRRLGDTLRHTEPGEKMKPRIGLLTMSAMFAFTGSMDGLQFLANFMHAVPFVGTALALVATWFIAVFSLIVLYLWLGLLGVGTFGGERAILRVMVIVAMSVFEMTPIINGIPAITGGLALIILFSRLEERGFNKDSLANGRMLQNSLGKKGGAFAQGLAKEAGQALARQETAVQARRGDEERIAEQRSARAARARATQEQFEVDADMEALQMQALAEEQERLLQRAWRQNGSRTPPGTPASQQTNRLQPAGVRAFDVERRPYVQDDRGLRPYAAL